MGGRHATVYICLHVITGRPYIVCAQGFKFYICIADVRYKMLSFKGAHRDIFQCMEL